VKKIAVKFKNKPFDFFWRGLYKTTIGRFKYGKRNDYDAARYWEDRFSKYGLSLKGSGDEGLSAEENQQMYAEAATVFVDLCAKEGIDFRQAKVLEIGCGAGSYTQLLYEMGVRSYVGVDITDALFPHHKQKFSQYKFVKKDITMDRLEGQFDVIVMIDVIEHIVNEAKFSFAMENVKSSLQDNGLFIVSPIADESKKHLFYVRTWSLQDIKTRFSGYLFRELIPFRDNYILAVRKV